MTGYGEAEETGATLSVVVEVRAVNNRYLKINYRSSDWIGGDETRVEKIVRQYIKRGTVQVQVRIALTRKTKRVFVSTQKSSMPIENSFKIFIGIIRWMATSHPGIAIESSRCY